MMITWTEIAAGEEDERRWILRQPRSGVLDAVLLRAGGAGFNYLTLVEVNEDAMNELFHGDMMSVEDS
jgi:hypothetical protein